MYIWVVAATSLQLAFTYLLLVLTPIFIGQIAILAAMGTLSIYVMNLSLSSWFRSIILPQQAISLFLTVFSLVIFFVILCKWRISMRSTALILSLTAAAPVVGIAFSSNDSELSADLAPFQNLTL